MDVITYPRLDLSKSMLGKGVSGFRAVLTRMSGIGTCHTLKNNVIFNLKINTSPQDLNSNAL